MSEAGGEASSGSAAPGRLLVSLVALGALAALWIFRGADDNRLTSWSWVFASTPPLRLYAVGAGAILLANLVALRPPARHRAAALFALACGAAASTWGAPEVVIDASRYFLQAQALEEHGVRHFLSEWGRGVPAWTDLPLVPMLDGLVFRAVGESRAAVQVVRALCLGGTVVVTHRLGRTLFGEEVGLAAGALLLAMPFLLAQAPAMLVDVPTMFFFSLALLAAVAAFREGRPRAILLACGALALALLSKWSTWLFLSAVPLAGGAAALRGARRPLRTGALLALGTGALVALVALPQREAWERQLALLFAYQGPGLRRWGESFASTFLFQVHPFVTAGAALSVVVALRRRDPWYAVIAWPVALLVLFQVRRARYVVPALPMLALLAAYGLQAIRAAEVRRAAVACAVATSLAVVGYGYLPFLRSTSAMNLASAGAYLDALPGPGAEVWALAQPGSDVNPAVAGPLLDLYTRKPLARREAGVARPDPAELATSPVRFSWECLPPPDATGAGEGAAVVVISGEPDPPLPEAVARRLRGYRLARAFERDERVFAYRTLVRVYVPGQAGPVAAAR